jgi:Fe-S cluster assembly protein SufD
VSSMSSALAERIVQEHASAPLPKSERRAAALASFARIGMPTVRDENWKYANLRPLEKVRYAPRPRSDAIALSSADLPTALPSYARYTFVDGVFAPELSSASRPAGLQIYTARDGSLERMTANSRGLAGGAPVPRGETANLDTRLALLNEAFADDGALIRVSPGVDCPACLEIVFVATEASDQAASYPRLELHVEGNARLGLIERHVSLGSDANFVNGAVDVRLERGAVVDHYRIQQAGAGAIWFDTLTASVAQSASYRLYAMSLGALSARSTIHTQLEGEGAEFELRAVSLAAQRQVHDTYALVEHGAPNTRSDQSFRGIASGRARTAFNSKVVVRKGAHRTDSHQSLRGLLAGPEAEIDLRPQLEIYTDDVKCNHGATTGKLDDQMLFYLLSRGIDRDTAQRLLKWAFLEDVVAKIPVPELRKQIELSLAGGLNEADALKELL